MEPSNIGSAFLIASIVIGIGAIFLYGYQSSKRKPARLRGPSSPLRQVMPEAPTRNDIIQVAEEYFRHKIQLNLGIYGRISACAGHSLFVWYGPDKCTRLIKSRACYELIERCYGGNHSTIEPSHFTSAHARLQEMRYEALWHQVEIDGKPEGRMDRALNENQACEFDRKLIETN